MATTAAFEMAMVHRALRNELHGVPELINGVGAGDAKRAAVVPVQGVLRQPGSAPPNPSREP
jgi:hypothetical protein